MKFLISSVLSFLMICATMALAGKPEGRAEDEAAIRALVADLAKAWTNGDARWRSVHFAEDVDYTVSTGRYIKGREAVSKGHREIFATIYKDTKQKMDVRSIRFLDDDAAVGACLRERGKERRRLSGDPPGGAADGVDQTERSVADHRLSQPHEH